MDEDWGSSSVLGVEIGLVELRENRDMLLPALLDPPVRVELRESVVRERRWLFIDPPKKSPMLEPGRAPNRLREMTSRPKMAARERDAVGVVGREIELVLNLNRPYW